MKILAIDTSTSCLTVALSENEDVVAEFNLNNKIRHSQIILPMIDDVLRQYSLKPADIDLFAVSSGPGSFTGVRIGMATVKGFSLALKKPAVGISTLDVLAQNVGMFYTKGSIICPLLDARENQVNNALYEADGGYVNKITDYRLTTIDDLKEELKTYEKVMFVGEGARIYSEDIKRNFGEKAHFAFDGYNMPKAGTLAVLAYKKFTYEKVGPGVLNEDLRPIYLKKSYAERVYEAKNAGN